MKDCVKHCVKHCEALDDIRFTKFELIKSTKELAQTLINGDLTNAKEMRKNEELYIFEHF